jgi:hypothetical protein
MACSPKYMVCDHVAEGEDASYLFRAIDTDAGYALCNECSESIKTGTPNDSAMHDVCVFHADKMLSGQLGKMLEDREKEAREHFASQAATK